MTNPPIAAEVPDASPEVNVRAWEIAFKKWERRRATPDELTALDRREALKESRHVARYGPRKTKTTERKR